MSPLCHREYLSQRYFSSVLYLNSPDESPGCTDGFSGGDLCFQDAKGSDESVISGRCAQEGEAEPVGSQLNRVTPRTGRLVAYAADERNVHKVGAVGQAPDERNVHKAGTSTHLPSTLLYHKERSFHPLLGTCLYLPPTLQLFPLLTLAASPDAVRKALG